MNFLLDTCVLSELRRPNADRGLVLWATEANEHRLHLSVVALAEIQKGIAKLAPGRRKNELQTWLDQDLPARFSGRILPVGPETALTWGRYLGAGEQVGSPLPVIDALVAATAATHNLQVVTRNERDFARFPVRVLNPWTSP